MKKIAIIGANEFQNPLILKAKTMGFETHVFAWQAGDIGEKTADFFYPISITEKDQILVECQRIGICAVASIGSDLATHTVNFVARSFGFPCNPEGTDLIATNKYEMRKAFRSAGLPVPKFAEAGADFEITNVEGMTFPMIVKPTDRSGSRGVMQVETLAELTPAIEAARASSFNGKAIVEEFIHGNEYSCESISFEGRHRILAFTKKFTTEAPHFIETGHIEPSDIPIDCQPAIQETICRALDALNVKYGAAHSEFRLQSDGSIRLIEIGVRMGGDCIGSDLVQLSTGYDFVRMVIDVACNLQPSFERIREPQIAEIHFIFSQDGIKKLEIVKKQSPEILWRVSEIEKIDSHRVLDSSSRFGYYIIVK